jgi:hypothetical protein
LPFKVTNAAILNKTSQIRSPRWLCKPILWAQSFRSTERRHSSDPRHFHWLIASVSFVTSSLGIFELHDIPVTLPIFSAPAAQRIDANGLEWQLLFPHQSGSALFQSHTSTQ